MLLLNAKRKSHMGNPPTPLDLTLSDLEGQMQGHSDSGALYLINEL